MRMPRLSRTVPLSSSHATRNETWRSGSISCLAIHAYL
jgi:hypothetical protein